MEYDACCGPLNAGEPARTALALMRSRFTAYAKGNIGYLTETLAPEVRPDFDPVEAMGVATDAEWQSLEIRHVSAGGEADDRGEVEYLAKFRLRGQQRVHHERAKFRRENGRWVVCGGEMDPKAPPRLVKKVGRNEPCLCGSGKKYKKCCGA